MINLRGHVEVMMEFLDVNMSDEEMKDWSDNPQKYLIAMNGQGSEKSV